MIIAIDFDGTCVTHEFPAVGKDIGAAPVLREIVANGHRLILYTMRSDIFVPPTLAPDEISLQAGEFLGDAVRWFKRNGIELYGIQTNPTQYLWTRSLKCYAQLYIDDSALGAPLKTDPSISTKPFVDWEKVRSLLIEQGIL